MLLSEGQMSDHKGAALLIDALQKAKGITPCIPPRSNRKVQYEYDRTLYKQRQRHKIENMFGRIKNWRRVAVRYDGRPYLHLCHLHRCYGHLLSQLMSSEPRLAT
jgi:transposase